MITIQKMQNNDKVRCLIFFHKIGIAWANKSNFKCAGFVAIYSVDNSIHLRIWRLLLAVKFYKRTKDFEWYYPKSYVLDRGEK